MKNGFLAFIYGLVCCKYVSNAYLCKTYKCLFDKSVFLFNFKLFI